MLRRDNPEKTIPIFLPTSSGEETYWLYSRYEEICGKLEEYKGLCEGEKVKNIEIEKQVEALKSESLRNFREDFELGRKIGRLEVSVDQFISIEKAILPSLLEGLKREQLQREHSQSILNAHCINDNWWDSLPPAGKQCPTFS